MAEAGVVILCVGVLMVADGLRIKGCNSHWLDIREDNNPSTRITCDGFSAKDTITWTLSVNGTVTVRYTCGPGSQQCVSTDSDVTLSRTDQGTEGSSVLKVVGNHRTKAGNGVVVCQMAGQKSQCNTNVVGPATVNPCRMTINAENWTVSGSCQYDRVYSSNGTYTCAWYRQFAGETSRYRLLKVILPTTNQSTTYGRQYYTGVCSLPPSELPVAEGRYIYTVDFVPGPDRYPAGFVTIQKPGDPLLRCPHYVYEGQAVQCSCLANSSAPGSPAAVVQWQGRQPGEALDIGQGDVSRKDTGIKFFCQLNWGLPDNKPRKTIEYTLKVAYGPDEVLITEDEGAQSSPPSSTLTLQCRAINVFPSANFTWSGVTCSSTTSHTTTSTCTFPWTPGDDKTSVTCTSCNSQFPQQFCSVTKSTRPAKSSDRGVPLGAVIGGTVAALVVIAVVIIIVVLIRRKRHQVLVKRKQHQVPETAAQELDQTDASSETTSAYSSLFKDDAKTPGRNPEPTNRDYTAHNCLCVQSPAPLLQRRDEAETANTYDLVGAVYENTPASVTSSSPTNIQPSWENHEREQQTSTDYENARPSQQGITRPEEETQRTPNDYYNTRGI